MGRLLMAIGLCCAVGCAGSSKEMREAAEHQERADQAASQRDYHKAAREQDRAQEYRSRAYQSNELGD